MSFDPSFGTSILIVVFSVAAILTVNMFLPNRSIYAAFEEGVDDFDESDSLNEKHKTGFQTESMKQSGSLPVDHDDSLTEEGSENNWRCACDSSFLPAGLLKSFGGAENVIRLGTGQCYHTKAA